MNSLRVVLIFKITNLNHTSMPGKHILASFDEALTGLKNDVIELGVLCRTNLGLSMKALLSRELEQVAQVLSSQDEMESLAKSIDEDAMNLIVRFQPVALCLNLDESGGEFGADLESCDQDCEADAKNSEYCRSGRSEPS